MSEAVAPDTLEIIRNHLSNVTLEMQAHVMQSAYSSMWQEAGDVSCAVLDPSGEIVGQADRAIPVHIATMTNSVTAAVDGTGGYDELEEGDVLIQNDPYSGNNHLLDFLMAQPVLADGDLVGFSGVRGHWIDVGGNSPTSYDIYTGELVKEGIRVPPAKLYRAGDRNDDLVDTILANVRGTRERRGDMQAQLAGVRHGVRRLESLASEYGADTLRRSMDVLLSKDETRMRARVEELPDGRYTAEDYLDGESVDALGDRVVVRVALEVDGTDLVVDFDGTDPQVDIGINAPPSVTEAAVHYAVKCALDPGTPESLGVFRPVRITAPEGSLVNPEYPAPVVAGNHETANRIHDAVVKAIAEIDPELAYAVGEGSGNVISYRSLARADAPLVRTRVMGGMGACSDRDGINAIRSGVGNTGIEPVERFEERYDYLEIEEFSIVEDTGGAGRYRGGNAARFVSRVTDDADLILISDRKQSRPFGVAGGRAGAPALHVHESADGERAELPSKVTAQVEAESTILLQPAGGGGYGDPTTRPPEDVLDDVENGYVSVESAETAYGVVLDSDTTTVDREATARRRGEE